ncbi:hypothetical protein K505DRAFT_321537 [Melanomma pulvis-pyrius CBS 109.77]|uniref:Cell death in tomato 1 n=1 Tax=Melanomma pulvis-pyrius CBS 109.77 TaxID=1314802 RepID=A0A6A6XTL2_9PLEO|nr:hypothetical protein K505DRAFT_321537 [Melanomma pulvis-pyrius CBS 109.77]
MFTTTFLASILAFSAAATAAPVAERQTTLSPWQVTGVAIFTPSGRPGTYPWPTITANVTDPNALVLGTSPADGSEVSLPAGGLAINCQAKWLSGTEPTNHIWPCDAAGDGYWALEVLPGTSGFTSTNFDLKFTRVAETLYLGSSYKKTFAGQGHFSLDTNLGGQCGGSGVCFWGLKAGSNPVLVQQAEVAA